MVEVIEVSRQIMDYLGVFKGSKPVLHNSEAMIIKGKTHDKIDPEEIIPTIRGLFEHMNIKEVHSSSETARKLTDRVDLKLRKVADVFDQPGGIAGLERLKHSYELIGCSADYLIGQMDDDVVVYVVMWMDKSEFLPMFVESMVLKLDPVEE